MLDQQIKSLYEQCKLDTKTISEQLDIDEDAVKLSLSSNSAQFRKELKSGAETFEESIYENAVEVMGQLLYAEQENVKLRAAKFIINENKGRHDLKGMLNNVKNININVTLIANQIKKARAALNEARVVDVKSVPVKDGEEN